MVFTIIAGVIELLIFWAILSLIFGPAVGLPMAFVAMIIFEVIRHS